jgi:hypothetical protein
MGAPGLVTGVVAQGQELFDVGVPRLQVTQQAPLRTRWYASPIPPENFERSATSVQRW